MKGQVSWFERMAFLAVHPVGDYFWTSNAENPGDRYGGTWGQIKDVFLLAAGDSYAAGSTGGEATHSLTVDELASHTHYINGNVTGGGQENYAHFLLGA